MKNLFITILFTCLLLPITSFARDVVYQNKEVEVYVTPGEPTEINFPDKIKGGWQGSGPGAAFTVEKSESSVIIFPQEDLASTGGAIIVKLVNGQSYNIRVKPSDAYNTRDDSINIVDDIPIIPDPSETPGYVPDPRYPSPPSSSVSGLMREMVLAVEFGKSGVVGYRTNDRHAGEVVLDDGTMLATIDKIYTGANFWGYVLNVQNLLETTQQLNPATFRIDGTRAVMAQRWQLAPAPLNAEQQLAGQHRAKVYVVTIAR